MLIIKEAFNVFMSFGAVPSREVLCQVIKTFREASRHYTQYNKENICFFNLELKTILLIHHCSQTIA